MFGLGKREISAGELGEGIATLVNEPISTDSARALGMRFENWDASNGWSKFVESQGVAMMTQMLHYRLWTHAAIQTFCTRFDDGKRRAVSQAAMGIFSKPIAGYDFGTAYNGLEDAFRGNYKFDPEISSLTNPGGGITYLPNPQAPSQSAKYLIQTFVVSHMPNAPAFIKDFGSYSSTLGASIGTVARAVDHIAKKFKI
jgi:hypothetical protein